MYLLSLLFSDIGQSRKRGQNSPVLYGLGLEILGRTLSHLIILHLLGSIMPSCLRLQRLGLTEKRPYGLFSASVPSLEMLSAVGDWFSFLLSLEEMCLTTGKCFSIEHIMCFVFLF